MSHAVFGRYNTSAKNVFVVCLTSQSDWAPVFYLGSLPYGQKDGVLSQDSPPSPSCDLWSLITRHLIFPLVTMLPPPSSSSLTHSTSDPALSTLRASHLICTTALGDRAISLPSFVRWGNWRSERWRRLHKATHLQKQQSCDWPTWGSVQQKPLSWTAKPAFVKVVKNTNPN